MSTVLIHVLRFVIKLDKCNGTIHHETRKTKTETLFIVEHVRSIRPDREMNSRNIQQQQIGNRTHLQRNVLKQREREELEHEDLNHARLEHIADRNPRQVAKQRLEGDGEQRTRLQQGRGGWNAIHNGG